MSHWYLFGILLIVTLICEAEVSTRRKVICERTGQRIYCLGGFLNITYAMYGRQDSSVCTTIGKATDCRANNSFTKVSSACNGEGSCYLYASNQIFGDPCVGVFKYLEVQWTCISGDSLDLIGKQENVIFSDIKSSHGLGVVRLDPKLFNSSSASLRYSIFDIEELNGLIDLKKENDTKLLQWLATPYPGLPTQERCIKSSGTTLIDKYFCIYEKSGVLAMQTAFNPKSNERHIFRIQVKVQLATSFTVITYKAEVTLKVIPSCHPASRLYTDMTASCPSADKKYYYDGVFPNGTNNQFYFKIPGPMMFSSLVIDNYHTNFDASTQGAPVCLMKITFSYVMEQEVRYFEYHKSAATIKGVSSKMRVFGNPYTVPFDPAVKMSRQYGARLFVQIAHNCTGGNPTMLQYRSTKALTLHTVPIIGKCPDNKCMDKFQQWHQAYKSLKRVGRFQCMKDTLQQMAYLDPCLDSLFLKAPYIFLFGKQITITCLGGYQFKNKRIWYHEGKQLAHTGDVLLLSGTEVSQRGKYWCATANNFKSPAVNVKFQDVKNFTVSVRIDNKAYNATLRDETSKEFSQTLSPLEKEIKRVLPETLESKHQLLFMGFRNWATKVNALFRVMVHIPNPSTEYSQYINLRGLLKNSAKGNGFGNLRVPAESVQIRTFDVCLNETTGDPTAKGLFVWPRTQVRRAVSLNCPHGPKGVTVVRRCTENSLYGASWTSYNDNKCLYSSDTTNKLENLASEQITNNTAVVVAKKLEETSQNSSSLTSTDTKLIGETISNLVNSNVTSNEVVDSVLGATSNVIAANKTTLQESQEKSKTLSKILKDIARLSTNVPTPNKPNTPATWVSSKVAIQAVNADVTKKDPFKLSVKGKQSDPFKASDIVYGKETDTEDQKISMTLPNSIFNDANIKGSRKLSFVVYKDDSLFQSLDEKANLSNQASVVNSMVLSVKVAGGDGFNLSSPLVGRYTHKEPTALSGVCVFWDFNAQDGSGAWSSNGCRAVSHDSLSTTCHCDHLTNFAILFDPYAGKKSTKTEHAEILSLISYIGIGLSLFGLTMTILTMTLFRRLRRTLPSKILVHLCSSLLLTLVVFVVGVERTEPVWACKTAAALLHYFLLVTFCWMLVEGVNLYLRFVKVLGSHISKFMLKAGLLCWGVPAGVIAILCPLRLEDYGSEQICIVSGPSAYGAVFAPILLILLINFVIFLMVMKAVRSSSQKLTKDKKLDGKAHLRISFMCCTLVGLTWIFGAFAVSDARVIFQYLFCIFNSLQGFFIFYFHVLRQADIRNRWINYVTGNAAKYSTTSSYSRKANGTRKDLKGTQKTEVKDSTPSKDGSTPNNKDSGYQTEYSNKLYEANIKLYRL